MLRSGDPGKDRRDQRISKAVELDNDISREEVLREEQAQKFFDEMQKLRKNLNELKSAGSGDEEPSAEPTAEPSAETSADTDADTAAAAAASEMSEAPAETEETESAAVVAEALAQSFAAADQMTAAETDSKEETTEEAPERETSDAPATEAAAESVHTAAAAPEAAFADQFRRQMETQLQNVKDEKNEQVRQKASKAAKAAKKEAYRKQKAARNEARRAERRARAKQKQKERELRAEVKRKKYLADKSAEMGGGIVNLHDTTVSTEVQPVPNFSWRDLLGLTSRRDRKEAETREDLEALKEEAELKKEEARAMASHLSRVRSARFHNSAFGRRLDAFAGFCDRHKNILLTVMSLVLLICVGAAGVINYCTAYEYSYNGHSLGYVKSKDEVLQITDMVQKALTEDKSMQVIIDARDDIEFQRVSTLDRDVTIDSSEDVLRRMTYIGDLNVKAYGIYVNGDKLGAVRSKDVAAEVLKKIEERYSSDKEGSVIEKAEILETLDVHMSNTSLRHVYSAERMADLLCVPREKETVHTINAGETLRSIAKLYGVTARQLMTENTEIDPKNLEVGSTILIRQYGPALTVRMTERRSYTQVIEYKTKIIKTDEMYDDEQEIQQEGEDGSEDIVERNVSINGEPESTVILKHEITKKPVKKIVLVGTAERPPTVGDGQYIWPLAGGYTLTSHYGYRWGRLHAGIDLGTPTGNDVLAADGGIVVRAGYFGGYGLCVDIDHQNGQMTRYGHLSSILVSVGDGVYEGQHIAESGNTGRSTGAHLHFEIHVNGQTHDPLQDLP